MVTVTPLSQHRYGRSKFHVMVVGLNKRGTEHSRRHNLLMVWPALVSDEPEAFLPSVWKQTMCATIAAVGPALFSAVASCKAANAAGAAVGSQHYSVANAAGEKLGNLWRCFGHEHHLIRRLGVTKHPDAESMIFQLLLLPPRNLYPVPGTPQFFKMPKPLCRRPRQRSGRERWRKRAEMELSPPICEALPFAKREAHFGQATRLSEKRASRMVRLSPVTSAARLISSTNERSSNDGGPPIPNRTAEAGNAAQKLLPTLSLSKIIERRISDTWDDEGSSTHTAPSSPMHDNASQAAQGLIRGASAPPSVALQAIFASARSDAESARVAAQVEAGMRAYDAAELAGADEINAAQAADIAVGTFRRSQIPERVVPMSEDDKKKRNIPVHRVTVTGRRMSLVHVIKLETDDDLAYALSKTIGNRTGKGHLGDVRRERKRVDALAESPMLEQKASHEIDVVGTGVSSQGGYVENPYSLYTSVATFSQFVPLPQHL